MTQVLVFVSHTTSSVDLCIPFSAHGFSVAIVSKSIKSVFLFTDNDWAQASCPHQIYRV